MKNKIIDNLKTEQSNNQDKIIFIDGFSDYNDIHVQLLNAIFPEYRTLGFNNDHQALSVIQDNIDEIRLIMVSFLIKGDLNGKQIAEEVAKINAKIPVVLTVDGSEGDIFDDLPHNIVGIIPKPYILHKYKERLHKIMQGFAN